MSSIKLSSRQTTAVLIGGLVLVTLLMYSVVVPLFNKWAASKFKDAATVQKVLVKRFAGKSVTATERVITRSANNGTAGRSMTVTISGNTSLSASQVTAAENIICLTLAGNAQRYSEITLLNVVEHRFLLFYSRQGQPSSFTCE